MVEYKNHDELTAGIEYTFKTNDGYFNSSSPLNIKAKFADKVVFEIPYGLKEVEISVRRGENIISKVYKVVI